jgi:hypothetical protein
MGSDSSNCPPHLCGSRGTGVPSPERAHCRATLLKRGQFWNLVPSCIQAASRKLPEKLHFLHCKAWRIFTTEHTNPFRPIMRPTGGGPTPDTRGLPEPTRVDSSSSPFPPDHRVPARRRGIEFSSLNGLRWPADPFRHCPKFCARCYQFIKRKVDSCEFVLGG